MTVTEDQAYDTAPSHDTHSLRVESKKEPSSDEHTAHRGPPYPLAQYLKNKGGGVINDNC